MGYTPWPKSTNPHIMIDHKIVKLAISRLLDTGYCIAVNNGEDYSIGPSFDADRIFDSLSQTDGDVLEVFESYTDESGRRVMARKADGFPEYVGYVYLVYGNHPGEIICDYTVNLDDVLKEANDEAMRVMG